MSRTIARVLVAALSTIALLAGAGLSSPAHAIQYSGGSGQPGSITFQDAFGEHVNGCTSTGGFCPKPRLRVPGPVVSRSPNGNAAQQVDATYRIYQYNASAGRWQLAGSTTRSYAVNQQVRFGDLTWTIPNASYWYVDMTFVWRLRSTGLELARRTATWNSAADYTCNTYSGCSVGAGYIYVK